MVSVHGGLPPSAACIVNVSVVFVLSAVISLIKLISPVEREVQNINMTNLMLSNSNDTHMRRKSVRLWFIRVLVLHNDGSSSRILLGLDEDKCHLNLNWIPA